MGCLSCYWVVRILFIIQHTKCVVNIFSQSVASFFIFLKMCYKKLVSNNLLGFSFIVDGFCVLFCFRDLCQFPGHKEFSPIFFFWKFYSFSFWNLGLWFKLIFVYVVRYESRFISLPLDTQLFQHHLLESFLSPLNYLGAFVKSQLPICEWAYFWAL